MAELLLQRNDCFWIIIFLSEASENLEQIISVAVAVLLDGLMLQW